MKILVNLNRFSNFLTNIFILKLFKKWREHYLSWSTKTTEVILERNVKTSYSFYLFMYLLFFGKPTSFVS